MTSMPDHEFAQTESLLRHQLARLADQAPTAVHLPGEVPVVSADRPARRGRRVGVIAAVTALIGAGGFTTYSFLGASNDGGAATPEEAVTTFVSAIEHEDVLGMIDVTLPEEVGALHSAVDSFTSDAKRAKVLADDFDAGGVHGVDVSIEDLQLDTEFLEGGLAAVRGTSGTLSASFDPKAFPFGDKVRAMLGDDLPGGKISTTLTTGDPIALLMTVQRDGRWYVSLEYTAADYVRRAVGWEVPGAVARTPIGFDSPEEAVTGFYNRLASLDIQSAMDTFAPGEDAMAWLAQSWLPDAQAAIDRGRADGWTVAVSGLTYETVGGGDHLTLKPLAFKVDGTLPAGFAEDTSGTADPSLPTVISSFDGSGYTLVPPGQVPSTIAGLQFSTTFPSPSSPTNFTSADAEGNIAPLVFPPEPTGGPEPFVVERADGCTTYTGAISRIFGLANSPVVHAVDGGYQMCGTGDSLGGLGLLLLSGGTTDLPSISVVQVGAKWYVSALGTASTSLHDVSASSSLFDSPLSLFIYGPFSRGYLEAFVKGRSVESVDAGCLPALTVENGTITGVVADPLPDAVRACSGAVFSDGSSTSSGTITEAPAFTPDSGTEPPSATIAP